MESGATFARNGIEERGMTETETQIEVESKTLYELTNVERKFVVGGSEVRAVDGITFTVERGEFVAIEGPSGSGKSTMLQLLGGLDRPSGGSITLNGKELSKLSDRDLTTARSRDIGFIFQQFNLIPTLTAVENVEIAMVPRGTSKVERRQRAEELLNRIGLGHRLGHLPTLLSGGEQQRVAICRALANKPSVILADEPTGNLDSKTAEEVVEILGTLATDDNVTVIIVTHAEDVASKTHRRLKMRDGKLVD
jgi:putative ABC transport system ATP-binding protein